MAASATLLTAACLELATVHVGMTSHTILRGALERDVTPRLFQDGFMARQAIDGRMPSEQFEIRLIMIEAPALFPGHQGVAILATACSSIGRTELTVRTLMTIGATRRRRVIGSVASARRMATRARHSDMGAFQGKAGLVVRSSRIDRRLP